MEPFSPEFRILLALATPSRFTDVARKANVSQATAAKYIRLLAAAGLVRKEGDVYKLTEAGERYLRQTLATLLEKIVEAGAGPVKLYAVVEGVHADDGEYDIVFTVVGQTGAETRLVINLSREEAVELCSHIKRLEAGSEG